jgi:hypothetical protein
MESIEGLFSGLSPTMFDASLWLSQQDIPDIFVRTYYPTCSNLLSYYVIESQFA